MPYGIKYSVAFTDYTLNILQKSYAGSTTDVLAGSPAVTHSWDKEDPVAPIKGSSITANIIGIPLLDFYSNNDDEFKCELYKGAALKFVGFLVQDDCLEDVDDLLHPVSLSFTDNIGLLNDVGFGDALAERLTVNKQIALTASGSTINIALTLLPGDEITIVDGSSFPPTYTIATVIDADSYTTTTTIGTLAGTYEVAVKQVLTQSKISLFSIIQACLRKTGIDLEIVVFAQLKEDSQNTSYSFLEQTYISRESFLKQEREYDNCFAVLETVLTRFQMTLMQAKGRWSLIRWFELNPSGFFYNEDYRQVQILITYNQFQVSGRNQVTYPEYGYHKSIFRPYNFVKETFNYKQPGNILKNADLGDLGNLIRTYPMVLNCKMASTAPHLISVINNTLIPLSTDDTLTITDTAFNGTYTVVSVFVNGPINDIIVAETVGSSTTEDGTVVFNDISVKEYVFTDWNANNIGTPNETYIRVVEDSAYYEADRYAVVEKNVTQATNGVAVFAAPIEVSKNDIIEFSFQFRLTKNPSDYVSVPSHYWNIYLTDGFYDVPASNTVGYAPSWKRLSFDRSWNRMDSPDSNSYGQAILYNENGRDAMNLIWDGVDTSGWQSVTIKSRRIPNDGFLFVHMSDLAGENFLPDGEETQYKDFTFTIFYNINDSTRITGQTHTNEQAVNAKNSDEEEITADDSPRSTISGTLFLPQPANQFSPRTKSWNTGKRLGEVTTQELKQWRSKPRTILEGNLYGEVDVSPLTTFSNPAFPNLKFVPGRMEIDYGAEKMTTTLHELYEAGEADVTSTYKFQYIYNTK